MNIHLILQSKGGVGKSFLSSVFAQYLISKGRHVYNIDIDPRNASFTAVKALNVQFYNIVGKNNEVDPSKFDTLIESIINANPETTDVIIDSGASCFINFTNYLIRNEIVSILQEMGHQVFFHTIIVGGEALNDTLMSFSDLINNFNNVMFYVWLNHFQGEVIWSNEKKFIDTKICKNNIDHIAGVLEMPLFELEAEKTIKKITTLHLTLDEASTNTNFSIIEKQRVKQMQRKLYDVMNAIFDSN